MHPTIDISIVIPVYKNEDTLTELHHRLTDSLTGRTYELLFVNDDSPDASLDILIQIADRDRSVGIITMVRNVGQQRAVMTGLNYASGEKAVVMDADLQDPPEAIPALIETIEGNYSAVFAGRRGMYQAHRRMVTSRLFKRLLSFLTGVPPDAGIYVALDRKMVNSLLAYNESRPYLVGMIGCSRLPMISIPIERDERHSGKSSYTALSRLVIGLGAIFRVIIKWKRGARMESPRVVFPVKSFIGQPFSTKTSD
jgi:glycosyltransferase involved in cell wall biosynthesis